MQVYYFLYNLYISIHKLLSYMKCQKIHFQVKTDLDFTEIICQKINLMYFYSKL